MAEMTMAVRGIKGGRAHRVTGTSLHLAVWTECGEGIELLKSELIPAETIAPEDRCKKCWKEATATAKPIPHGTWGGYVNRGCRCAPCTEAWARYHAQWRARVTPSDVTTHGTHSTYNNYGCRCDECRAANTREMADYRARKKAEADQ